jgi:hypothetical protein
LNEEFFAQKNIKKLRETFKTNTSFPHLVLEGLFSPKLLELMHSDFDNPQWNDWTHYDSTNERKLAVQSQLVLLEIDAEDLWLGRQFLRPPERPIPSPSIARTRSYSGTHC